MKNAQKPTLEDVARESGASTATISRALNEPHKVAKATLENILKVVDKLGYTPNFGGRLLASNRSNTVGAIIPTMANSMFAGGLQAFQEVLADADIRLLVASSGYNSKDEFRQIHSLITHGADGLLLIGSSRPPETTQFLAVRNIPYVISWCFQSETNRIYSGFDNAKAASLITEKVLSLGHQRIAMIAGISMGNDRASNRIDGVARTITQSSNNAALIDVIEAGYSLNNGGAAFEKLMSRDNPPTAIICGNDVLAAGAIVKAREMHIKVPDKVSITGFDDLNLAAAVVPALTTVRVPQVEMGRTAALLLLQLLAKESTVSSKEFATEIIERDSLGPAPNT